MRLWDFIGYVAAALVFTAFYMREVFPSHLRETAALRMTAMCGNLAFIVYGVSHDLVQVWLLHALLLPMNARRLLECLRAWRHPASRSTEGIDPRSRAISFSTSGRKPSGLGASLRYSSTNGRQ
jgi:hypothetical protein